MGASSSTEAKLRDEAATKVQAAARGRLARRETQAMQLRSVVRMRINLPAGWHAADGVPPGLEFEVRRHLALVGQHLVVSKMRAFGTSRKIGAPELVLQADRIQRVHRCDAQKTVFSVDLGPGHTDRLFRAANEETRDMWVRALLNVSANKALSGRPQALAAE
jgi:hypothetical protein